MPDKVLEACAFSNENELTALETTMKIQWGQEFPSYPRWIFIVVQLEYLCNKILLKSATYSY